jgi:hypothetical protein
MAEGFYSRAAYRVPFLRYPDRGSASPAGTWCTSSNVVLSGVVNPIVKTRRSAMDKMSAIASVERRRTNDESAAIWADLARIQLRIGAEFATRSNVSNFSSLRCH